jgi:hypothetical protein
MENWTKEAIRLYFEPLVSLGNQIRQVFRRPQEAKRAPGNFGNYVPDGDGYKCKTCGSTIMAAEVSHSVHWKGFNMAGPGRVETTREPYCPKCETKPDPNGSPVYE